MNIYEKIWEAWKKSHYLENGDFVIWESFSFLAEKTNLNEEIIASFINNMIKHDIAFKATSFDIEENYFVTGFFIKKDYKNKNWKEISEILTMETTFPLSI